MFIYLAYFEILYFEEIFFLLLIEDNQQCYYLLCCNKRYLLPRTDPFQCSRLLQNSRFPSNHALDLVISDPYDEDFLAHNPVVMAEIHLFRRFQQSHYGHLPIVF